MTDDAEKLIVLVPEHWYLVRIVYGDAEPVTTVVQFLGVDEHSDMPTFTGYESLGVADYMHVIREVKRG